MWRDFCSPSCNFPDEMCVEVQKLQKILESHLAGSNLRHELQARSRNLSSEEPAGRARVLFPVLTRAGMVWARERHHRPLRHRRR